MTDLMDRYLAAVERRLPKEQSKDIVAELREAISAKVEAKEEALGRPAGAEDVAAILKEFGHPVVVASRYSGRDYLIGPNLYPWFWDAQRVGVGLVFALVMVITAVKALKSERAMAMVIGGVGGAIEAAIWMFGVITVVFIVMERTKADVRIARGWNPKALPQDHIRKPKALFDTLFALAFDAIFILWWIKVVDFPNDVPGRGNSMEMHFAEGWAQMHTPILVLALLTAAVHVSDIIHPAWSRLRSAMSILGHLGGLAVLWVLIRSGPLVSVTAAAEESQRALELAGSINAVFGYSLAIVGLFWAIGMGVEVWRQVKAARPASLQADLVA
jgi:hypothetical protein